MSDGKRYVVRGKDDTGFVWYERLANGDWDYALARTEATSLTLSEALAAADEMRVVEAADVQVFSVSPDGTETPLPTYEEALNALAMARDAAEMALRRAVSRGIGSAPSELEGCPTGALRALLRLLGGGR